MSKKGGDICRILVIGASLPKVANVISILEEQVDANTVDCVEVDYLPCIAAFATYKDEAGKVVKYLASMDNMNLLPVIDEHDEELDREPLFPGLAGGAIGCGIFNDADVKRIQVFFDTLFSGTTIPKLKCIQPSPPYKTMAKEMEAYRALSDDEKQETTRLQTTGPGKMAKFVKEFTTELVQEALAERRSRMPLEDPVPALEFEAELEAPIQHDVLSLIDPEKDQYLCRMCRTPLFGEVDLQYPPHEPSRHQFSHRKHGASTSDSCQSFFLQDGLSWMGSEIRNGASEGKFACPSCKSKLGGWHWSGAQCSCGTWVVPAIQIPKSKIDVVTPAAFTLPPGTVPSPLLQRIVTPATAADSDDT